MACSMPPMYWSTGNHWRTAWGSNGRSVDHGSAKRRKYHDESTKVSIVSVSRVAGPPLVGHGLDAVLVAVHDRDRAAPVALPGQQPVPQAVVDGAAADALLLQPPGR